MRALVLGVALLATTTFAAPKTHTVKIVDMKFVPETVTVKKGDTVVWKNEDLVPHTVMGGAIRSEIIKAGESFRWSAEKTGQSEYMCTLHPNMRGKVMVK